MEKKLAILRQNIRDERQLRDSEFGEISDLSMIDGPDSNLSMIRSMRDEEREMIAGHSAFLVHLQNQDISSIAEMIDEHVMSAFIGFRSHCVVLHRT